MAGRKFSFVTFILLLLLAAATANFLFVYYHGRVEEARPVAETPAVSPVVPQGGAVPHDTTASVPHHHAPELTLVPPNAFRSWHDDVTMVKSPEGGYDLIVQAVGNDPSQKVPATAVEVDIRHPGDAAALETPTLEHAGTGKFVAHVDLGAGDWEVRTRIHRGLQTLEFAEKFELK